MMRPLQLVRVAPTEPLWIVSAVETRERERAFLCPRKRAVPLSLWGKAFGVGRRTRHGSYPLYIQCHTPGNSLRKPCPTRFTVSSKPSTAYACSSDRLLL